MTMEEWLRSQRENAEIFGAAAKERGAEAEKAYYDGMMEAIDALLSNLPEFEHVVTVREVKDFCQKQLDDCEDDEAPCEYCPMAMECSNYLDSEPFMVCGEIADILPRDWDVDAIERRIKEARNERRSNSTVKSYTENS